MGFLGALAACSNGSRTMATLVSISVDPANSRAAKGTEVALKASGIYTDNSVHDLTSLVAWTSSAPAVASVGNASGSNGITTAISPGTASIRATLGSVSASTTFTVTPAMLVSIGVSPAAPSLAKGTHLQLTATGVYTDNTTQDLTATVTWNSAPTIASISSAAGSQGLVTAVSPGSTSITATISGVSGSTTLKVTPATLVSIGVTPANPSLPKGLTTQFTATGIYTDNSTQNLTADVNWSSSDPFVASVSSAVGYDGVATALIAGSTTVTATFGSVSGSTALTVTPATLVSITVTPASPTQPKGTREALSAIGVYSDNSTQNLTTSVAWTSSDTTIASVSNMSGANGNIQAISPGSVIITAASGTVSGSTGLTVTAAALISITVIPSIPSIANGTSQQFAATGIYTDNSMQPLTASVTWSSSDTSVASISNASGSNGLASSASQGAVTITATLGPTSGSTALTVTPATLVSIAVTPATPSIANRTTQQFTATGTYTDTSVPNLTAAATWTSSDTTIASISNAAGTNGLAAAVAVGTSAISATIDGVTSPSVMLAVTAAPEYAYVANSYDNTVSEYTVGAGGALTSIGTVATGVEPEAVTVDPTGRYAYVLNWNDNTLSEYTIGAGGALTAIGTMPTGTNPAFLIVDPSGQYAYVANDGGNSISEYSIGTGGVLTAIGTVSTGSGPDELAIDPTDHYAYVVNTNDNTVSEYTIGASGGLTPIGTAPTGNGPQVIAIDPSGSYAYVTNWTDNTVSEYSIGSGGTLATIGTVASGNQPTSVAADPTGHYVYVSNFTDNTISEYAIGTGGILTTLGTVPAGNGTWFITVDPTGSYVYVVNAYANSASEFAIGAGGVLIAIGSVATGSGPADIAVSY
jgi:trimeric autotransporter adhesin